MACIHINDILRVQPTSSSRTRETISLFLPDEMENGDSEPELDQALEERERTCLSERLASGNVRTIEKHTSHLSLNAEVFLSLESKSDRCYSAR